MRLIPSTSITSLVDDALNLCVLGISDAITAAGLPTTAATFAPGCEIVDKSTSKRFKNTGTTAVPVWAQVSGTVLGSYAVVYAGKHTTAGGAAGEDKTITGVVAGDIVIASLIQKGATPRTLLTTITGTDKITLTFSGDPSTDHIVGYMVLRAT